MVQAGFFRGFLAEQQRIEENARAREALGLEQERNTLARDRLDLDRSNAQMQARQFATNLKQRAFETGSKNFGTLTDTVKSVAFKQGAEKANQYITSIVNSGVLNRTADQLGESTDDLIRKLQNEVTFTATPQQEGRAAGQQAGAQRQAEIPSIVAQQQAEQAAQPESPLFGNSQSGRAFDVLLDPNADPSSPEYAAAWAIVNRPQVIQTNAGTMLMRLEMPSAIRPPTGAPLGLAPETPASPAPIGTAPAIPASPAPIGTAPGTPGSPGATVSVIPGTEGRPAGTFEGASARDQAALAADQLQRGVEAVDKLLRLSDEDPSRFGAKGSVRQAGRDAVGVLRDFGLDAFVPDMISEGLDLDDPALSEIEILENALAFGVARARQGPGKLLKDAIDSARAEVSLRGLKGASAVRNRLQEVRSTMIRAQQDAQARSLGSAASSDDELKRRLGIQ